MCWIKLHQNETLIVERSLFIIKSIGANFVVIYHKLANKEDISKLSSVDKMRIKKVEEKRSSKGTLCCNKSTVYKKANKRI